MPRVGSAAAVGATIRDSRRQRKSASQGQDDAKSGNPSRSSGGRASATKRLSSLQDETGSHDTSRPSSFLASDSPDLPEILLPGDADGGEGVGGAGGGSNTRTGITPDLRAYPPPPYELSNAASATQPSVGLSPPTPTQLPATPDFNGVCRTPEAASINASVEGDGSGSPGSRSVDEDEENDEAVEALPEEPKVEIIVDMSATGDWNGLSTLEKPRETDYDRPEKGWKTSLAKTFGFFLFFGLNAFLISYLVPMVFRAMLGL